MADFYIDFTAAGGGNGSFATPWNRYGSITGVVSTDKVWVRRVSYTETAAATSIGTGMPDNTPIIGWPLAGDTYYSTRPAAAQAAWDPDAGLYAEMRHNAPLGTTVNTQLVTTGPGDNVAKTFRWSRLKFFRRGIASMTQHAGVMGSSGTGGSSAALVYYTENCWFEVDAYTANAASIYLSVLSAFSASGSSNFHSWTDVGSTLLMRDSISAPVGGLFLAGSGGSQGVTASLAWRNTLIQLDARHANSEWFTSNGAYASIIGTIDNCTFELLQVNRYIQLMYQKFQASTGLLFHRCTFKTPPGSGGTSGWNRMKLWNRRFVECSFIGVNSIDVNDPGVSVSIDSFRAGAPDVGQPAIYNSWGGTFVRGSSMFFTPSTSRDVGFVASSEGRYAGLALLRTVSESGSGVGGGSNTVVAVHDPVGSPGHRKWTTLAGTSQSVAVSRVGGARYSFLLTPAAGTYAPVLGVGTSEPGFDSILVSLKPGLNTITMFCTHTGYAVAPTTADVWLEIEVPTTSGRVASSARPSLGAGVALAADTSTWNVIPGIHTPFTVTISVTVGIPVVALVRCYAGLAGGSVYVDPSPAVS